MEIPHNKTGKIPQIPTNSEHSVVTPRLEHDGPDDRHWSDLGRHTDPDPHPQHTGHDLNNKRRESGRKPDGNTNGIPETPRPLGNRIHRTTPISSEM